MIIFKPLAQWMKSESGGGTRGGSGSVAHWKDIFWVHLGFWTFSDDCLPFHLFKFYVIAEATQDSGLDLTKLTERGKVSRRFDIRQIFDRNVEYRSWASNSLAYCCCDQGKTPNEGPLVEVSARFGAHVYSSPPRLADITPVAAEHKRAM